MKKNDPKQLQLNLQQDIDGVTAACNKLGATMAKLIKEGAKAAPIRKIAKVTLEENRDELRKTINRSVRHMARLHQQDHKTLWTSLYDRFAKTTGFDAILVGIKKQIAPIEALQQHGKLGSFLQQLA